MNKQDLSVVEAIDEIIKSDIEEILEKEGIAAYPELVVVDYVGLAVELSHCNRVKSFNRGGRIGEFPDLMRRQIAVPHHCPVWLTHQLNAVANERDPCVAPRGHQAKDCSSFPEHFDVLFTISTKDEQGLVILTCDKNAGGQSGNERILILDGAMATLRDFEFVDRS